MSSSIATGTGIVSASPRKSKEVLLFHQIMNGREKNFRCSFCRLAERAIMHEHFKNRCSTTGTKAQIPALIPIKKICGDLGRGLCFVHYGQSSRTRNFFFGRVHGACYPGYATPRKGKNFPVSLYVTCDAFVHIVQCRLFCLFFFLSFSKKNIFFKMI